MNTADFRSLTASEIDFVPALASSVLPNSHAHVRP